MRDTAIGYTGQRRSGVSGHYLLGNGYRGFNPMLKRFAGQDSLSPFGAGGEHGFAYCGGNPANYTDPSGHFFFLFELLMMVNDVTAEVMADTVLVKEVKNATDGAMMVDAGHQAFPKKRKPPLLKITPTHKLPQFIDMENQKIKYVHGSQSGSLKGVAHEGGLLSMADLEKSEWIKANPLTSGERGYTKVPGQTVHQGVSLHYSNNYLQSLGYTGERYGNGFPVLYGISDIDVIDIPGEHPVSNGSISAENIISIYVYEEHLESARDILSTSTLINKLRCFRC